MEAELRDGVMVTLDAVASEFEAFRKLQEKLVGARLKGADLSDADRAAYGELAAAITQHLKTLKLNNNRIEALVDQLYAINKKLMGLEGRLMRLADGYGISRPEFLKAFFGAELNPEWTDSMKAHGVRWTKFLENEAGQVGDIRGDVAMLATETGVPIDDYRRHRPDGAEGRARGPPGQEGDGGGQPATRHLHRQEIHQPRPAIP